MRVFTKTGGVDLGRKEDLAQLIDTCEKHRIAYKILTPAQLLEQFQMKVPADYVGVYQADTVGGISSQSGVQHVLRDMSATAGYSECNQDGCSIAAGCPQAGCYFAGQQPRDVDSELGHWRCSDDRFRRNVHRKACGVDTWRMVHAVPEWAEAGVATEGASAEEVRVLLQCEARA